MDDRGKYRSAVQVWELLHQEDEVLRKSDADTARRLASDRPHYLQKKRVLCELLGPSGLFDEKLTPNTSAIITSDDLGQFVEVCRKRRAKLEGFFDLPLRADLTRKPAQQLGSVLGLIGLRLEAAGTRKSGKRKTYLYKLSERSVRTIQEIAGRRADEKLQEEWRSNRDRERHDPITVAVARLRKGKVRQPVNDPLDQPAENDGQAILKRSVL